MAMTAASYAGEAIRSLARLLTQRMQELLNSESLYESLAIHNSQFVSQFKHSLSQVVGKLKAVTLKQAHIAQAYTEASTDFCSFKPQEPSLQGTSNSALQFNLQS